MNEQPNKGGRPPLPDGARAESHIHLRVTRARKAAYVRAAVEKKATLAKWCFGALDRESGYTEGGEAPARTIGQRWLKESTGEYFVWDGKQWVTEGEDGRQ